MFAICYYVQPTLEAFTFGECVKLVDSATKGQLREVLVLCTVRKPAVNSTMFINNIGYIETQYFTGKHYKVGKRWDFPFRARF